MPQMDLKQKSATYHKVNDTVITLLYCVRHITKLDTDIVSIAEIITIVNPSGRKGVHLL